MKKLVNVLEFVLAVLGASLTIFVFKQFGLDLNDAMLVLLFMIFLKV